MSFKFSINISAMDFSKIHIMSRGLEVDKAWCDSYRIKHIYNKIENVDIGTFDSSSINTRVKKSIQDNADVLLGRVHSVRGSCMLVEGGLKDTQNGGHVIVTTIFHFEDEYSMSMFIMRYPHKMWDHMKDLFIILN